MSKREWTPQQKSAIETRGGSILVTAAAGSGKTAVLVERVVKALTDENNPIAPDRLLVVTFTNAAASEMKQKIIKAVNSLSSQNPSDMRLRRCAAEVHSAHISTMDSFCIKLVRDNFSAAGTTPDFTLCDGAELTVLRQRAVNDTIEQLHDEHGERFSALSELFVNGRDDKNLADNIIKLYDYSMSYPFPSQWLQKVLDMFSPSFEINKSVWGRGIIDNIKDLLDFSAEMLSCALNFSEQCSEVFGAYGDFLVSEINMLKSAKQSISDETQWDDIYSAVKKIRFERIPRVPKGYADNWYKTVANEYRSLAKKATEKAREILCADSVENFEDMTALSPAVGELIDAVKRFAENFAALKAEINSLDFNDTVHLALRLLYDTDSGKAEKSHLASVLSESLDEILIDEYQDTNEAQDMLFRALSRDESNLFTVGDAKQSIYGFRLAMPDIFIRKSKEAYAPESGLFPVRIILGKNFRSRRGILGAVNFIFEQLMSEKIGEMEYSENEKLYFGGTKPDTDTADFELHLLGGLQENEEYEEDAKSDSQAAYVARYIRKLVDGGAEITVSTGETRKIEFSDICILLRKTKIRAGVYAQELSKLNIPVDYDSGGGYFSLPEIRVLTAMLNIIDNPVNDIALLTVMMFPLFGFTPEELSEMRLINRSRSLWHCLGIYALQNSKANDFLNILAGYRELSSCMDMRSFVLYLTENSGFSGVAAGMKNGDGAIKNIQLMLEYADEYTAYGGRGLSGFVRFLDRIEKANGDAPTAAASEGNACVRIMSMHKSKGLEFPVVILGDCTKKYNTLDVNGDMITGRKTGVGLKRQDRATLRKFSTLSFSASKQVKLQELMSEELRILYVAMTRACEKLVVVTEFGNPQKKLFELALLASAGDGLSPSAVSRAQSMGEHLVMALLSHPDAEILRERAGVNVAVRKSDFRMNVILHGVDEEPAKQEDSEAVAVKQQSLLELFDAQQITDLKKIISEKTDYVYPYLSLSGVLAKQAASRNDSAGFNPEYVASSRPSFISSSHLTPAQRGTAYHKFMQLCDFAAAAVSCEAEANRLEGEGALSSDEKSVLDYRRIERFFASDCGLAALDAERIYREFGFNIFISAGELYPDLPESMRGEKILMQGMADLVFIKNGEAFIVDYKTDKVKNEQELRERYSNQLSVYRRAVSEVLGIDVKRASLYSMVLERQIEIL